MSSLTNVVDEAKTYQRIGEFVVSFQWLESQLREIGWFILDPTRKDWPPLALRNETLEELINKVRALFLEALPKCRLPPQLDAEFREDFHEHAVAFHRLRQVRNRVLHSAYVELKAGGELQAILRSDPKARIDPETGSVHFDEEILSENSFDDHLREIGRLGLFFNRCLIQLRHRLGAAK